MEGGKEELKAECNVIELQKKSNILTHFILGFCVEVAKHSLGCCGIQGVPPHLRCDLALGSTPTPQIPAMPGELGFTQVTGTFLHCSWRERQLEEALCARMCVCTHTHTCTQNMFAQHTCCAHKHAWTMCTCAHGADTHAHIPPVHTCTRMGTHGLCTYMHAHTEAHTYTKMLA